MVGMAYLKHLKNDLFTGQHIATMNLGRLKVDNGVTKYIGTWILKPAKDVPVENRETEWLEKMILGSEQSGP